MYIDNIDHRLLPISIANSYYQCIKKSDLKIRQEIDTIRHTKAIFVCTKEANSGFLYINSLIMDNVRARNNIENMKIKYIIDNKEVADDNDISKLVKLKKRRIASCIIKSDELDDNILLIMIILKY
ncbi:hypothetical protein FACS1894178_6220 [Bacteroidia bacterium]|nr:hypothetical protein FACS1894178_6220 [Bacteroidia bacterium]